MKKVLNYNNIDISLFSIGTAEAVVVDTVIVFLAIFLLELLKDTK